MAAQPSAAHGDADQNEGRDSEQSLRATQAVLLRGRWPGGWILLVLAVWGAIAVSTIADRF